MDEFTPAPIKATIGIPDLDKLDIRIGTILSVEDGPKSSKLVHQVLFVVNLEPRGMAGELWEGMLFDIGFGDGVTPTLSVPERPVPNGARVG